MFKSTALLALSTLFASVSAQNVGTLTAENHPALTWYKCTTSGGCVAQAGKVVLDANWRWLHSTTSSTNCYTGNTWNASLCPNNDACTTNCALDGADYSGTYGVTTSGNALTLKFVTPNSNGKNVGSRLYLMKDDTSYEMFKVLNQEFTFDVDVSKLPCGLNGAVYFSEMQADGGMAANPTNKAGAKYGTGYCDSQCPRDLKFIAGKANSEGWTGTSANSGTGKYGACCNEMDIWEANSISTAYTPHPCDPVGPYKCTGDECGQPSRYSGVCDPDGCDFNPYRQGDKNFYGPGKTVNTTQKFTIVTQFITDNGTATGNLKEIRRLYVQNGVVIANSVNQIPGIPATNAITDAYCDAQKSVFGDTTSFQNHGGLTVMGDSLKRGGVLVLSIWDDYAVNMHWLNSYFPPDCTGYGCERGTCPATSGVPAEVEVSAASASVTYSNIRVGDIGSTYSGSTSSTTTTRTSSGSTTSTTTTSRSTTTTTTTTTTTANGATQTRWGQCGGQDYTGPTNCESPYTCTYSNPWYSQCL
ncbi:carbohydrate-binding module family 1 protein [Tulasnella calospora MUT 4182]|uniref:Glucanase n=1 Tax=Tulasnella calospora MUT 4182 TaxID=1051891 RepID=A0A0C3QFZ1_9AGAM|nr:carbohydrate-binding module family 1 protein [Tulasnella calospora MUT 4182]